MIMVEVNVEIKKDTRSKRCSEKFINALEYTHSECCIKNQ